METLQVTTWLLKYIMASHSGQVFNQFICVCKQDLIRSALVQDSILTYGAWSAF